MTRTGITGEIGHERGTVGYCVHSVKKDLTHNRVKKEVSSVGSEDYMWW